MLLDETPQKGFEDSLMPEIIFIQNENGSTSNSNSNFNQKNIVESQDKKAL